MSLLKVVPEALNSVLRISDAGSQPRLSWLADDMIDLDNIHEVLSWNEIGRQKSLGMFCQMISRKPILIHSPAKSTLTFSLTCAHIMDEHCVCSQETFT